MGTIMTPPSTIWAKHRLVNPNVYGKFDAELILDTSTASSVVAQMQAELNAAITAGRFTSDTQLSTLTLPLRRCDLAAFTMSGGTVYASSYLKPPVYDATGKQLTDAEVAAIPNGASGRVLLDVNPYDYQGTYGMRLELLALQYLCSTGMPQTCPFPTMSTGGVLPASTAQSDLAENSPSDLDMLLR